MKRIYVVVGALVLAPAVTRVMACSEPPGHPVDAGRGDVIGKDSAKDGPGFADVDAGPRPCGVPGYRLDDAYDPTCGFGLS